jgi:hypothetical protein
MKSVVTIVSEIIQLKSGVDSDAFNIKLAELQELLGVQTGDIAGYTFSDYDDGRWERMTSLARMTVLRDYIHSEISEILAIEQNS